MLHKLRFKVLKKFDGSMGLVEFFLTAILRLTARNMGDKYFDFEGTLFQSEDITIKTCTIELALQVLPYFMKPTGLIKLAFETDLMSCFRYSLGECELQVSFFDFKAGISPSKKIELFASLKTL